MEKSTRVLLVFAALCMAAVCEGRSVPESDKYQPQTIFAGGAGGAGGFPTIPGMPGLPGLPGLPGMPGVAGAGTVFGPLVPGFGNMPGGLNVPVAPGGGFFGGAGGLGGHP